MNTGRLCYKGTNIKIREVLLKSRKLIRKNKEEKGKYECRRFKEKKDKNLANECDKKIYMEIINKTTSFNFTWE